MHANILVDYCKGDRQLGRLAHRRKDNVIIYVKERGY